MAPDRKPKRLCVECGVNPVKTNRNRCCSQQCAANFRERNKGDRPKLRTRDLAATEARAMAEQFGLEWSLELRRFYMVACYKEFRKGYVAAKDRYDHR